jgi:repressor of nif and glnA expression
MRSKDRILEAIITVVNNSDEPLETKEIEEKLPKETRAKILYRLRALQGAGLVKGKMVGAGKGTWIWWRHNPFVEKEKKKK